MQSASSEPTTPAASVVGAGQRALFVVAGYAAIASGILGIAMVGTLVGMYAMFALGPDARDTALRVGAINDALAIVVYGLLLPVIPALHVLVRDTGSTRSLLFAFVGLAGVVVTMVLQWLLVTGGMSFEEQIGPVSVALLAVGAWMVGTGYLALTIGAFPRGLRDGLLGAVYVGMPIWAVNVGKRLLRLGR